MKQPHLSVDLAPHEQQLGKYRLVAKLGQGGMGTVYLALASGLGSFRKLLVVKELRHDLPWRESSLSMFMDEAQLAARLDHPNVLQTFEAGEAGGRYFLAMEYLDGQPLSTLIDHGVPLELHVYILCEVLQGLQYAHDLTDYDGTRLHVVHRDVSPQNVFVTHHGQVKVVDFGVAKANNGSNITSPGVFKGKFAYAAPEQLFGRPVDGRCDVFAVGVMLWEAIAGRRFGVPKPTVDAFRVRTQGLEPRIAQVTPDVDPLLAEICDHALAIDPLERVESADALRARLQEWLALQGEHIQAKQIAELMRVRFSDERVVRQRIIERAMVDAGASQSTIAALPRELFDRESGMSPRVEHSSASGISPAHVLPQPTAARQDSVHTQHGAPKLTQADESVHAANLRRAAAEMKQPSRLSSAAVLVIVAGAVFGLTYQLSRKATEPSAAPQLRSGAALDVAPRSTETSASPATTPTVSTTPSATAASEALVPPPKPAGREASAPSSAEAHEPAREPASREPAHGGMREPRERTTRTSRERSERVIGQAISAQTAAGRDHNEPRDSAAVGGTSELSSQTRATAAPAAKSIPASSAKPAAQNLSTAAEAEPSKAAARAPAERVPAAKARTTARDANMGSDMRQLRSGGAMRIDTEDPYK
jgi:eukaryotic-like serine/threonine-protein kinase